MCNMHIYMYIYICTQPHTQTHSWKQTSRGISPLGKPSTFRRLGLGPRVLRSLRPSDLDFMPEEGKGRPGHTFRNNLAGSDSCSIPDPTTYELCHLE